MFLTRSAESGVLSRLYIVYETLSPVPPSEANILIQYYPYNYVVKCSICYTIKTEKEQRESGWCVVVGDSEWWILCDECWVLGAEC